MADAHAAPADDLTPFPRFLRKRSNFLFSSLDDAEVVELAKRFVRKNYEPGDTIVEQGDAVDATVTAGDRHVYFYILADGECQVTRNGRPIAGGYGLIEKGTSFGEIDMLFGITRTATIVASRPSETTGKVVVFRLKDTVFRQMVSDAEIAELRTQIMEIQKVVDTLSGVDTKFGKGTVIRQYVPSAPWLCRQWTGTILQYVWTSVVGMMVATVVFGLIVCAKTGDMTSFDADHEIMSQIETIVGWWPM